MQRVLSSQDTLKSLYVYKKTPFYFPRMNADGLVLQQHEQGYMLYPEFRCLICDYSKFCDYRILCLCALPQVTMEFGLDKRAQTLQGLAFPLQEEAKRALQQLKQKRINYIQLVSPVQRLQICSTFITKSARWCKARHFCKQTVRICFFFCP